MEPITLTKDARAFISPSDLTFGWDNCHRCLWLYYTGDTSDLKVLRQITDEIMQKIQELSGQEYVDMYASEAKFILMKQRREEMKDKKRVDK